MKIKYALIALIAAITLHSCDEDTNIVGNSVMPGNDKVTTSLGSYVVATKSVAMPSVLANTSTSYLGSMIDPETRATTTASFMAQFRPSEDFRFPEKSTVITGADRLPVADSVEVELYVNRFYGDSLRTMKMSVQELDTARVMEEGRSYSTDINPADYVLTGGVEKTLTYSVHDQERSNLRQGYHLIRIKLPAELGTRILRKYYENKNYFSNSYQFNHHVLAGFHFSTVNSVGSMLSCPFLILNVYYSVTDGKKTSGLVTSFASTEEVIQTTKVSNSIPASMLDATNPYTYLKSPSGILTEGTLPIDKIYEKHEGDSINSARIIFRTLTAAGTEKSPFPSPSFVLLLPKSELTSFFAKNALPDSRTSFLAQLSGSAYTFSNIGSLIRQMASKRDRGAGVLSTDSEAQKAAKRTAWEASNGDWDKFVVVPVAADYTITTPLGSSTPTKVLQRIRHDLGLTSVRIEGGSKGLELSVIYSSFKR